MTVYNPHYEGFHALLIGVDSYPQFPPLNTAVKGVRALADVLHHHLHFPAENITILVDEEATQRNIRRRFTSPLSQRDSVGPDDGVVIYFAGHGVTVDTVSGPQGYIVPYDAEPEYYDSLIAMDELTRTAAEHIHAKHVIFLLDACFSGFATVRMSETVQRQLRDYLVNPVRQVIAAGTRDQAVSDLWGPEGHSLFTGFLLEGLRGAAPAPGGILRAFHLAGWLQDQVGQHSRAFQTPQYAALLGSRGGDFIFSTQASAKLPDWLESAIESQDQTERLIAVSRLLEQAQQGDSALVDLVRTHLEALADDESGLVRSSAQAALEELSGAGPVEEPSVPDVMRPAPAPADVKPARTLPAPEAKPEPASTGAVEPEPAVETAAPVKVRAERPEEGADPVIPQIGVRQMAFSAGVMAILAVAGRLFPSVGLDTFPIRRTTAYFLEGRILLLVGFALYAVGFGLALKVALRNRNWKQTVIFATGYLIPFLGMALFMPTWENFQEVFLFFAPAPESSDFPLLFVSAITAVGSVAVLTYRTKTMPYQYPLLGAAIFVGAVTSAVGIIGSLFVRMAYVGGGSFGNQSLLLWTILPILMHGVAVPGIFAWARRRLRG